MVIHLWFGVIYESRHINFSWLTIVWSAKYYSIYLYMIGNKQFWAYEDPSIRWDGGFLSSTVKWVLDSIDGIILVQY